MAGISRSIPAVVALLLLSAHFYRAAALVPAVLSAAAVALVFVRRPWAAFVLRLGLAAGSIVWIVTAWGIAQERMAAGKPYLRMLAILGAVAAFTAVAAGALPNATARKVSRP
jgi:hypothetical protein